MSGQSSNFSWSLGKIIFAGLIIQNLMLTFSVFLASESDLDDATIFIWAMSLDLLLFFLLMIFGIIQLTERNEFKSETSSVLLIIGSVIFIYFSLTWRISLEVVIPLISDIFVSIVPDLTTPNAQGFDAITALIRAIQISNFGLLLMSLGLFQQSMEIGKYRYFVLIYGIVNMIFVAGGGLIVFKLFTPILVLPFLIKKLLVSETDFPFHDVVWNNND